jgi:outer membrane autotransporter protein
MPLTWRARAAWAHDWVDNPTLTATFLAAPPGSGAGFTVTGASPAHDSALVSVGAELRITRSLSLGANFDGEFASGSQTYSGKATVRVSW